MEAVAAEVAHELMAPINYFRSLLDRYAKDDPLDEEDIDIAREEIARLEGLLATLRRLAAHRLDRKPVSLEDLLRPFAAPPWDALELAIDPRVRLSCDERRLILALQALAENALAARGAAGRAGIAWRRGEKGPELCVWDTGPGFSTAPRFAVSDEPGRAGLGLTVARRTVRAHGWKLEIEREADTTRAAIYPRTEDVLP